MIQVLRHWREGLVGLLLIGLALGWAGKSQSDGKIRLLRKDLATAERQIETEREQVRAQSAIARAMDAANKAHVEQRSGEITRKVENDYVQELGDLRRRYDALRLRKPAAATDKGGRGTAAMPGVSGTALGVDDPAGEDRLPAEDALIASEQALRLKALQRWVSEQAQIPR